MIQHLLLPALLLAVSASGAGAAPGMRSLPQAMGGTWGYSSEACTNEADDGRVEVKPREVTFFATYCALRRFRSARDGTITAHGLCRGEGETTTERGSVRFRLDGPDRLVIALDGGEAHTFLRCERSIPVR